MKTKQKKQSPEDDLEVLEIKLERIPIENIAEVTETLACNFLRNAELGIFYVCYATPKQWPRGRPLAASVGVTDSSQTFGQRNLEVCF